MSRKYSGLPVLRRLPQLAGAIVSLAGLLVIISWYAHWRLIVQVVPGTAPMQYNTALCFIIIGLGLFLQVSARPETAKKLSALVLGFVLLTMAEYVTGRDFKIDQLFFKPYFQVATTYPGRMSPLTGICFIFISSGLIAISLPTKWAHRLTVAGMLACIVIVISLVAMFGFFLGIQTAYGWGAYSSMAANTALAFLFLGTGLLIYARQVARAENFNFLRWLPVTASVTLMAMVAFVSAVNMAELSNASYWRKHTFQVILKAQAYEENLIELQRGVRGYVTLNDTNALASYAAALQHEPALFTELTRLTADNPSQQQCLQKLSAAMREVFAYDLKMLALYREQGSQAIFQLDATGQGRIVFGNAHDTLKAFSKEEERLLDIRDNSEQADYHNAARLLVVGSVLAALLLIMANHMASRELRQRKRIELKLRELTTLQNAILNSANYAIIALDAKGIVRTFNPAAERMLGYSAAEVIGLTTPILWRDPAEVAAEAKRMSQELGRPIQPGVEILTAHTSFEKAYEYEVTYIHKRGQRFPVLVSLTALSDAAGSVSGFLGIIADITERKNHEAEREKLIGELKRALADVKILSGMIPICGWCKSVRSDQGFWQTVEDYVRTKADVTFSHGICPSCTTKMKNEIFKANPSATGSTVI